MAYGDVVRAPDQPSLATLTSRAPSGLWHAYFEPGPDGGGNWINPYDPGGGYTTQAEAEAAAMKSAGQMTVRQPSADFGFEQFVIPALAGGIGLGAAGLGPLAGAGGATTAASGGFGLGEAAGGMAAPEAVAAGAAPATATGGAALTSGGEGLGYGGTAAAPAPTTFGMAPGETGAFDQFGSANVPSTAGTGVTGATVFGGTGSNAMGATGSAAATSGTALSRILAGSGTTPDYLSVGGAIVPAALSAYGSKVQADKLGELAGRYEAYGAPYRQTLADISTDPSKFYNSPAATKATDAILRRLSVRGNPAGDPYSQALGIDALYKEYGAERDRLAGYGGLTQYNAATPGLASGAIGAQGAIYSDIGYGLGNVLNPKPTLAQQLAQFKYAGGLT